jgi:hypothetical protein
MENCERSLNRVQWRILVLSMLKLQVLQAQHACYLDKRVGYMALDGCEWSASLAYRPPYSLVKSPWYPLARRMGGPQCTSERLPLPAIEFKFLSRRARSPSLYTYLLSCHKISNHVLSKDWNETYRKRRRKKKQVHFWMNKNRLRRWWRHDDV